MCGNRDQLGFISSSWRFLLPMINDHRDDIADVLGEQLGVQVSIANIEGRWLGMRPEITVEA